MHNHNTREATAAGCAVRRDRYTMRLQSKQKSTTGFVLRFIGFTAVGWAVFGLIFMALPILDIVKFFLFQLLAVVAPGLAWSKALRLRLTPLETLTVSYGLGIGTIIAVYFMFAPFHITSYLPYGIGVVAAASLFALWRMRARPFFPLADDGSLKIGLIFCAIAMALTTVVLSASMLEPSLSGARAYFHDTLNGVNFVTSASRGYPMKTLEMAGLVQYYHIFLYSYAGTMKLCTGITSFAIMTKYTLITISPLIAAAVVSVAKRILKDNRAVLVTSILALLIPYHTSAYYLYVDTIGFTLGLAFAVISVLLFLQSQQAEKAFNRYFLLSIVCLLGSLGAKGPLSVSILFGLCFCLLLQLIREKKPVVIAQGLCMAGPFFALYLFLYSNSSGDSMSFSPFYDTIRMPFYQSLHGKAPEWLAKFLGAVQRAITLDPFIAIALVLVILWMLRSRKRERDDASVLREFCLGAILEGAVMLNLFKQMGSSEIYFLNCLWPFAYIIGARALIELFRGLKRKYLFSAVTALALVPVLISSVNGAYASYTGGWQQYHETGIPASIKYNRFAGYHELKPDARRSATTPAEYEGLLWLRDNTPKNAVIADGRYLHNNKYFANTAFSERAFFVGGYGFVTMEDSNDYTQLKVDRDTFLRFFYASGDEAYLPLLAREGCTYVIICEFISPGLELSDKYVEEVFRNDEMKIYKLKPEQY